MWVLPLSGGPARRVATLRGDQPVAAAFSTDSRVLFWAGGRALAAVDLESGASPRIELPTELTGAQPPLVAVRGSAPGDLVR